MRLDEVLDVIERFSDDSNSDSSDKKCEDQPNAIQRAEKITVFISPPDNPGETTDEDLGEKDDIHLFGNQITADASIQKTNKQTK